MRVEQMIRRTYRFFRPAPDPASDALVELIEQRKAGVAARSARELRRACDENVRETTEVVEAARHAARRFQGNLHGAH